MGETPCIAKPSMYKRFWVTTMGVYLLSVLKRKRGCKIRVLKDSLGILVLAECINMISKPNSNPCLPLS
jgi:hypothetical protein